MSLIIGDVSEYNGVVDPVGQDALIIRMYNGNRADHTGTATRANTRKRGTPVVGLYHYLVKNRDAATQAAEFCAVVGSLAPNEVAWCDLEEGSGNQAGRYEAWRAVVQQKLGRVPPTWRDLYSGLAFAKATGLQPWWTAAYQANKPATPWAMGMWQFSDAHPFPWGHDDASLYAGTVEQLAADLGLTGAPATTTSTIPASSTTEAITVQLTPGSKTAPFILPNPGSVLWLVADAGGEFPVEATTAAEVRVMLGHGGTGSAWKPLPGGNAQTGSFGILNGTAMKVTPDMCAGTGQKIVSVRNIDPKFTINAILVP